MTKNINNKRAKLYMQHKEQLIEKRQKNNMLKKLFRNKVVELAAKVDIKK